MRESQKGKREQGLSPERKELSSIIEGITNDILYDVIPEIGMLVRDRARLDSTRDVVGRENEDAEADIDTDAEEIYYNALNTASLKYKISFRMHSEHGEYTTGSRAPYYHFVDDPVENTDELIKNLEDFYVATWSLFSFYDPRYRVLGGGACNLRTLQTYAARDGFNVRHNFFERHSENDLPFARPQLLTSLDDPRLVISIYRAREKYDVPFNRHFAELKRDRHPKSTVISTGGNYIYVPLALGRTHLHIAPNEPFNEVFSGFSFAKNAGAEVSVVERNGRRIPLKFHPSLLSIRGEMVMASLSHQLMDISSGYYTRSFEEINQQEQIFPQN